MDKEKPKGGVGLLIGIGKPKGESEAEEKGEAMGSKSAAVDSIMSAFEAKDKAALESALTTFVEACSKSY